MANEAQVTLVGNLTADPELRFTPSGAAVANFTVAVTPRVKNGDQWEDGEAAFYRCAVWREYAENVAESFQKGQRVIVVGRLKPRSYEARDGGGSRLSLDIEVDEVGHSLRFGSAQYARSGGQNQGQQRRGASGAGNGTRQQPRGSQRPPQSADPWATGPAAGQSQNSDPWAAQADQSYGQRPDPWNGGQGGYAQEPPF